jgi:phage-related protein
MPATTVLFYREGLVVPAADYVLAAPESAFEKLVTAIDRLKQLGHSARRPLADYLDDGIYELRVRDGNVQHRLLYFFHGRAVVILTHGFTKDARVPPSEIRRAKHYRERFLEDPGGHSAQE